MALRNVFKIRHFHIATIQEKECNTMEVFDRRIATIFLVEIVMFETMFYKYLHL